MAHVTVIHGIANKPAEERLLRIWLNALAFGDGIDSGANSVTSAMVYWADVMYPVPIAEGVGHEGVRIHRIVDAAKTAVMR